MRTNIYRLRRAVAIVIAAFAALSSHAMVENADSIKAELKRELAAATSTSDSVKLMYDIFDLSERAEQTALGEEMLDLADRINNVPMSLEMIRHLSNLYTRDESKLIELENHLDKYPNGRRKHSMKTFLALRRAGHTARYSPAKERMKMLRELIAEIRTHEGETEVNSFHRIEELGSLCILLGNGIYPGMVKENLSRLLNMVDSLPPEDAVLRNLIYNQATAVYTNLGMAEEANKVNREILSVIDDLKDNYHKRGRNYRDLETNYYVVYRNMIQNFESLTEDELDNCYEMVNRLAASNAEIARDYSMNTCEAFYSFAKGNYAKATKLLKQVVANSTDNFVTRRALRCLLKAAKETGDSASMVEAAEQYIELLEDYIRESGNQIYSEMQVMYDIDALQTRNNVLELAQTRQEADYHKRLGVYVLIALGVLFGVVVLIYMQYRKSKRLQRQLSESNESLRQESESLKEAQQGLIAARDKALKAEQHKSEFIDNMSHEISTPLEAIVEYSQLIADCADAAKKPYLQTYADIVKLNNDMLVTLVRDVLEIGRYDEGNIILRLRPALVSDMCMMAIESVRHKVKPGVKITCPVLDNEADNRIILTDGRRVEQVLINLLSNSAKFTPDGGIELSVRFNDDNNTVSFIVSDTGIGIPKNKHEEIFKRFAKLDKQTQGVGLGLSISRMIANLLHGTLKVDPDYFGGTRMVFTIPMS